MTVVWNLQDSHDSDNWSWGRTQKVFTPLSNKWKLTSPYQHLLYTCLTSLGISLLYHFLFAGHRPISSLHETQAIGNWGTPKGMPDYKCTDLQWILPLLKCNLDITPPWFPDMMVKLSGCVCRPKVLNADSLAWSSSFTHLLPENTFIRTDLTLVIHYLGTILMCYLLINILKLCTLMITIIVYICDLKNTSSTPMK